MTDRPAEAARLLRAALGFYRGDLLGSLPVSPGMDAERERLPLPAADAADPDDLIAGI